MNFKNELALLKNRMFTDETLQTVLDDYLEKSKDDIGEVEYRAAAEALADILDEKGKNMLADTEKLCRENALYAMRFGFERGIFACFSMLFGKGLTDLPCSDYAEKELLMMPKMAQHSEFYTRRNAINDAYEALGDGIDEAAREHVVSFDITWHDRERAVLGYAFYMGYRYAADMINDSKPVEYYLRLTNMLLIVEHELGFTKSLVNRERFEK